MLKLRMHKPMTNLLPCPFCGGAAKAIGPYGQESLFKIECQSCYAKLSGYDQCEQDAVDAWNTRAVARPAQEPDDLNFVDEIQ